MCVFFLSHSLYIEERYKYSNILKKIKQVAKLVFTFVRMIFILRLSLYILIFWASATIYDFYVVV